MELDQINLVASDTSTMSDLTKFLKSEAGKEGVFAAMRHLTAKSPFAFPENWPENYRTEQHQQLLLVKGKDRIKYEMRMRVSKTTSFRQTPIQFPWWQFNSSLQSETMRYFTI